MNQFMFTRGETAIGTARNTRGVLSTFPAGHGNGTQPVDHETFISAMKGAATGVNIVTTNGHAGQFGLTVSAFASVSAEPPLVLVCINRSSPACAAILDNRRFCVNVLSSTQEELAKKFAGMPAQGAPYEFAAQAWAPSPSGNPALRQSVAAFDCSVLTAIDAGTHTVFTGLVESTTAGSDEPLIYCNRNFGRIVQNRDDADIKRS